MTGLQTLLIGKRGHHSSEANGRFRKLLEALCKLDYDRHFIFEYDSLCVIPEIPIDFRFGVHGISFLDERPSGSRENFEGKIFIHPPLAFTTETIAAVLEAMNDVPDKACNGFWDRWLGYACERGNIPVHCWRASGLGFSRNTILREHFPEACQAAGRGAVLFHGVKTAETLQSLLNARRFLLKAA